MKKTFVYIMAAVAAIAAVSCSKIENEQAGNVRTFTATFASDDTRATIGGKVGTSYPVSWEAGDEITVYDNDGNSDTYTVQAGDIDGNSVTFSVAGLSGTDFYAIFGASSTFDEATKTISFSLPTTSYASLAACPVICAAKNNGASFAFKNATAILHLSNCNYAQISLSKGKPASISAIAVNTQSSVTISLESGFSAQSSGAILPYKINNNFASDYYFIVAPGSCYLSISATNNKGTSTKEKTNTIECSQIINADITQIEFPPIN